MPDTTIYKTSEVSVETELDGEIALMNIDSGEFFALKDTGLAIWRRIDGMADQLSIVQALCAEYDVEPATCMEQVKRFCQNLLDAGLIVTANS